MGGAHGSLTWHASKPSARARSTVRNPPNLHQRLRVTPHGSHTWLASVTSRIVSRPSDLATSTNLGRSPLRAHRSRGNQSPYASGVTRGSDFEFPNYGFSAACPCLTPCNRMFILHCCQPLSCGPVWHSPLHIATENP